MIQQLLFKSVGACLNLLYFLSPQWAAQWAIKLFSTPRSKPIRAKEMAFLGTARQVRRSVGDLPFVEYHWGDAGSPLVLLSYGWEYNAGRWRYFVPALVEAGYRVIAYDPTGHGLAPEGQMNVPRNALIIRNLIEKYGKPEVLIGHSFGGGCSIFALSEIPEWRHPKRMVIMASFSYAPRIFREFAKQLGLLPGLYFRVIRAFEQRIGQSLEAFDFARMSADMPHISGLVVHSPADEVTPYSEAKRYFDFWENAALYSPREGGHHLGTPEITQAVLDFAIQGILPESAEVQRFPMAAGHDLVRFFPGM